MRNKEKSAELREERGKQILDAALTVYIRFGYHGTDMDAVAKEAGIAKGLLYYYFKTKKDLFAALYSWMFREAYSFSADILAETEGMNPVEQLMYYTYGMFGANARDIRFMQFNIRVPFDAYAVFGPDQWKEGAKKSDLHRKAITGIIERGAELGLIKCIDPGSAANSFWSVFVANAFEYARLMEGGAAPREHDAGAFQKVVQFCFQGLGVDYAIWMACLEKIVSTAPSPSAGEPEKL